MEYGNSFVSRSAFNEASGSIHGDPSHSFTRPLLSDEAINAITDAVPRLPGPECEVFIAQVGGAMSRVTPDATAYPHRNAHFIMNVHTRWRETAQDFCMYRVGARAVQGNRAIRYGCRLRQLYPG